MSRRRNEDDRGEISHSCSRSNDGLSSRLYERDPFTNKPKKSPTTPEKVLVPPISVTRPVPAPSYNSIIFPRQSNSSIPLLNSSLFPSPQYSYPSLLNNNNTLLGSNFSIYSSPATGPSFCYSPSAPAFTQPSPAEPLKNLQTSVSTASPSGASVSANGDVSVHYIGGFVIRESSQPFSPKEKENPPPPPPPATCRTVESTAVERDLPLDPGKWTVRDVRQTRPRCFSFVIQVVDVGEFISRLTSTNIRDAFYESEIDGQALLLMTPEHLRETLKIKLGPSLIIASEIGKLRERAKTFSS